MAQTPTTLEPRVRFWHPDTMELLWTSACDVDDLVEEVRQELAARVSLGEWIPTTIDLVPAGGGPEPPGTWRSRWGGKVRVNPDTGALEMARTNEFLSKILQPADSWLDEAGNVVDAVVYCGEQWAGLSCQLRDGHTGGHHYGTAAAYSDDDSEANR